MSTGRPDPSRGRPTSQAHRVSDGSSATGPIGLGLGLGLAIGAVFGVVMNNLAFGLVVGIGMGLALGIAFSMTSAPE
jgi:hypothetical protein